MIRTVRRGKHAPTVYALALQESGEIYEWRIGGLRAAGVLPILIYFFED
jgi:hypothetical protein